MFFVKRAGYAPPLAGGYIKRELGPLWTPANLAVAPALWLSADTGVTQAAGAVSNWDDQSANNYQFAQATAANQPAYSATGFNGTHPAITADGTNDFLRSSTNFAPIAAGFVLFIVLDNWSAGRLCRDAGASTVELYYNSGYATLNGAGTSNILLAGTSADPQIITYDSASLANSRVNGTVPSSFGDLVTQTFGASGFALDLFSTGGTNPSNAAMADFIVAASMSEADRRRLEGWAAHKNGVTHLLPEGHAHKLRAPRA